MFYKESYVINTKNKDMEVIKAKVVPILKFAEKHGYDFLIGPDNRGDIVCVLGAEGRTNAYCKGVVTELKQMVRDEFHCRLERCFVTI